MRNRRKALGVLLLATFIDILDFGLLLPLLPLLFADPKSPYFVLGEGGNVGIGLLLLGLNEATFYVSEFVATPILGQFADRFGRKPLLFVSLVGTAVSYVLLGLGLVQGNLLLLFLARAVDGLTGGNETVAQAAVADLYDADDRPRIFGYFSAAYSLGFVFGPLFGGFAAGDSPLAFLGPATPMWIAAVLSTGNAFLVWRFFDETLKDPSRERLDPAQAIGNVQTALRDRDLRPVYGATFLYNVGFTLFTTVFNVFLLQRLGFGQRDIGVAFTVLGGALFFADAFLVGPIKNALGLVRMLRLSLLVTGVVLILSVFARAPGWLVFLLPAFALANSLASPALSGLVSERADDAKQGEALGVQGSMQSLGRGVAPLLAGPLSVWPGVAVPIAMGGAVVIAAWTAYRRLGGKAA